MLLKFGSKDEDVRRLQAALNQLYDTELVVDGDFGPATESAVVFHQGYKGLDTDGVVGDLTWGSIFGETATEPAPAAPPVVDFEPWDGPAETQPATRAQVHAACGNPPTDAESKAWINKNIVYCVDKDGFEPLPYHEDFKANYWVGVHKIVEPYLREALRRARVACPDYRITRIACYNWRTIKNPNATTPKLSMHAYGFAVDINSHDNPAKTFKRGQVPKAWSPEWTKHYPKGIPEGVVRAFQSCGFAWGSDWDEDGDVTDHTWCDAHHMEWIARDGVTHLV